MMSKFIAESAVKTYDSLQTEDERTVFLSSLRQEMRSALEGKEPGHLDDLDSASVSVINFLVKAMKCTFDSIAGRRNGSCSSRIFEIISEKSLVWERKVTLPIQ